MIDLYRAAFEAQPTDRIPEWLVPLRASGLERFAAGGFPTARDEEWRFTPLGDLPRTVFAPARAPSTAIAPADLEPHRFGHPEWPALVFVNGAFAPELSEFPALPAGVTVTSLSRALVTDPELVAPHLERPLGEDATPFAALNTAFIKDGAFVRIAEGVQLETPITLLFVVSPDAEQAMIHPRNVIVLEPDARCSLVESYIGLGGKGASFTNTVTDVVLGERAWAEHTRIQREDAAAYHVGFTQVQQQRESHYRAFTLSTGGRLSRHNLHTRLGAPETEALLYGLSIAGARQVVDNHTAIYHDQPSCRSWEVYKTILDDHARGVFNGKVFVTPEAQQTDAKQTNRTLLLSDTARIDTKPQLEIFADDVKCTHGATVGYLDELPLFYFRSRGIEASRAKRLLTYAFAAEVMAEVAVDPVRDELDQVVRTLLGVVDGF